LAKKKKRIVKKRAQREPKKEKKKKIKPVVGKRAKKTSVRRVQRRPRAKSPKPKKSKKTRTLKRPIKSSVTPKRRTQSKKRRASVKRPLSKAAKLIKAIEAANAKLKRKRKAAVIRGWRTRRTIAELERKLAQAEVRAGIVTERYAHFISLENLPPRMIHETAIEHTIRIVKMMRFMGYNVDQSYTKIATHTGVQPREVYTAFMYVGNGEFVA
jgi:hypothetical protein